MINIVEHPPFRESIEVNAKKMNSHKMNITHKQCIRKRLII